MEDYLKTIVSQWVRKLVEDRGQRLCIWQVEGECNDVIVADADSSCVTANLSVCGKDPSRYHFTLLAFNNTQHLISFHFTSQITDRKLPSTSTPTS